MREVYHDKGHIACIFNKLSYFWATNYRFYIIFMNFLIQNSTPNDIVEEFANFLFHTLQKMAIFTRLYKGL